MPTQIVESPYSTSPKTTTISWDSLWHQPNLVDQDTVKAAFVYNSTGAPLSKTLTDKTIFGQPYPTYNRTRTWNYSWNSNGQLLQIHGPRWVSPNNVDTTTFTYNTGGYLATITNGLGQITTITSWDWRGAPSISIDLNGIATNYAYDIRGRILSATVNPGTAQSQYQFAYDQIGGLAKITMPMGATLNYTFDQERRVARIQNVRGETRSFTYDNDRNPLSISTKSSGGTISQSQSAKYDEWSRIIQSVGAANQIWSMAYDNLNNLVSVTDPLSHQTQSVYDEFNRITTQKSPLLASVQYSYDSSDNIIKLTDPRGLPTARKVDGFNQVIQESSPDRGVLTYWYDLSGNLIKSVDGDSVETNFTYDAVNRPMTKSFPTAASENVTFTYDQTSGGNYGVGRLTNMNEASGSTSFKYDAQGRVISDSKVISGSGYVTPFVTSYGYDANGKVIQITYPSGNIVNFARAPDGLITAVTSTPVGLSQQTIASGISYKPFGPLANLSYGNGLLLTRTYDQDYLLTGVRNAPSTGLSCCRFDGHRDKVFYGTGGYECNDASSAASSSSRR